jgi:CRP-like cAMP-binding protein
VSATALDQAVHPYDRIEHILRENPFFEEFAPGELDYFARQLSLRSFAADTVLFRKGDLGSYLFFIVEGEVEVRLEASDLKQVIIATFERGSCVGEMAIVDDYPRSATIIVTQPSELLLLTRGRFETICIEQPGLGLKFLKGVAKNLSLRLRKTSGRFADLA